VLTRRAAADRDVTDEVQHYLEEAAAAHASRGLTPQQALRAARLDLGGETGVTEQVRAYGWENVVSTSLADLRYGARRLGGDPAFTLVSVLTLALGIGATTAIFSAVNPILVQPLPYPHAEQVVTVWEAADDGSRLPTTFVTFRALAERSHSFATLAVMRPWQPTLTGATEPERLDGQRVSASYFDVLGVQPALGRSFSPAEDHAGSARVVVLSDALWRRRFHADRAVLGRPVDLDGDPYTMIGVMPRGLDNVLAPEAALWMPLRYEPSLPQALGHHLRAAGRLRPGVGIDQAGRELAALAPALRRDLPNAYFSAGFLVSRLQDDVTREVKPALLAVVGAVALLLLIACVNVTNLLLARGARRRGELAVRAALGAGRARMVRQLLAESLLLAGLGGALGLALAAAGVRALVALSPLGLPRAEAIAVDGWVLAFALGMTTLVGLAFGLAPALRAARGDLLPDLRQGSRRAAGGNQAARGRLVVAEVALALVLLVGSGLLLRSLRHLLAIPSGFQAEGVIAMQVQTAGHRFDDDDATRQFFARSLDAVRQRSAVTAAAFTSQLPLSGDDDEYGVRLEPSAGGSPDRANNAFRYAVSPGYFQTLGIPLRQGRLFDDRDRAGAPLAIVVSQSFARHALAGIDPLGRRLQIGPLDAPWFTVVGVVGDVKQASLAAPEADAVYVPNEQWPFTARALWLVARGRGDPASLAPALRRAVWSVDRDQPIVRAATMESLVATSAARQRFTLVLFEVFALAALALAAAGIYGVLAGTVAERRRELGVRAALGASQGAILGVVLRQGLRLAALGALVGLVAAAVASRALGTLLFGVTRLDPATYLGVVALLLLVSAIASGAPAWRAARVDPALTLREE
jgi:putative ABC transport system permease protein